MNLSSPFVLRPVATTLLAFAVFLCGLFGYRQMTVSSLPQVDFPIVEITTQLPGANPDTVASTITASLEREFGHIPSLVTMSSLSSYGISRITLQFELDRDIDAAAQDVQSAINSAGSTLPRNLPYPPVYRKVNPADPPILTLAIISDSVPIRKLADIADTQLGPYLAQIAGVGRVSLEGASRPAVRVQADISRLAAYRLSLEDVRAAIVRANVSGAKGLLEGPAQAHALAANDQIDRAVDYETIIIDYRNARPVMLRDVANVVEGLENSRLGSWYQGRPAIILNIQRQPGANIVATVDRILTDMPRLKRLVPAGAAVEVVFDRTSTIRASIAELKHTLLIAIVLVNLVILLFLRNMRATIIAAVSLPLSLIAAFSVMSILGFSINNLTLMALTIATGFVIDDSIVMIENIVRKTEDGLSPLKAALEGAREIGFTVLSLTLSLIAVFIPLLYMTGLVGRMFREFAVALAITVVVSAFVSLTLTPMMCSRLLRSPQEHASSVLMRWAEAPTVAISHAYMRTLDWALRRRGVILLASAGAVVLTIWMYVEIPKSFLPLQDTSALDARIDVAPQASFAEMTSKLALVTEAIRRDRQVLAVISVLGVGPSNSTSNSARLSILLEPRHSRKQSATEIAERLRGIANTVPGVDTSIKPVQELQITSQSSRAQYQYTLSSADSVEVLAWAKRLAQSLSGDDMFRNIKLETIDGGSQILVDVNRETAGRLGLSAQAIQDNLNDAFSQRQVSIIYAQANQYRIILEADPIYARDPDALEKLYVAPEGLPPVPLRSLAQFTRVAAPLSIFREQQFPAVTISFDLAAGASLEGAIEKVMERRGEISLPSYIPGRFGGDAEEFQRALANQPWLILAAIVSIYIVLGVLYESFVHPFTILTTLPTAGIGAFIALRWSHEDLSIIALIGIILLMGIVKKNAIMMIDFALDAERNSGLSPYEAIVRACHLRFRPIMMTTIAALLGALPLAWATGAGSELRSPLGITIVGGLILSQILTLYTTPVIYLAVDNLQRVVADRLRLTASRTRLRIDGGKNDQNF